MRFDWNAYPTDDPTFIHPSEEGGCGSLGCIVLMIMVGVILELVIR
jgi:hypothetical protein